jgi:hypothetical protein
MSGLARLPAASRAKLSALERSADDAAALASAALASIKAAEARTAARLHALETTRDPERASALRSELEAIEADSARLQEALSERQSRRDADQRLVSRLHQWIDGLPAGATFEMVAPPAGERGDGGPRAAIERCRREIADLRAELEAVARAPLPVSELKARARAWVDERAARGRPALSVDRGKLAISFRRPDALVRGDALGATMTADTLAWLHRDALIAALDREIDALGIVGGLTDAERASRTGELRAAILDIERMEESVIEAARGEGTVIARRPDASPFAILGIRFVGAAAQAA